MGEKYWRQFFNAIKKEDWETAKTILQNVLAEERNNPHVYLKMGDLHQRTGDIVSAVSSYHQSAWILKTQGFIRKALIVYKIIIRLDPFNSEASNNLNELLWKLEAGDKSKIETARTSSPSSESMDEFAIGLSERSGFSTLPEIFSGISEQEATKILNDLEIKSFSSGDFVIKEGEQDDTLYIIKTGQAHVVARVLDREVELDTLGSGDIFGEIGFLTNRPRTASVIAVGPLDVYEVGRLELERIIEMNPDVLAKLEEFYEIRVSDTVRKMEQ
jgi:CRP-like cAMP-binding protein